MSRYGQLWSVKTSAYTYNSRVSHTMETSRDIPKNLHLKKDLIIRCLMHACFMLVFFVSNFLSDILSPSETDFTD